MSADDLQVVRLTFQAWDSRATFEVPVLGNQRGFDVVDAAIWSLYEKLPTFAVTEHEEIALLKVTDKNGNVLECEDDELCGDGWLKEKPVSAEIICLKLARERRPA